MYKCRINFNKNKINTVEKRQCNCCLKHLDVSEFHPDYKRIRKDGSIIWNKRRMCGKCMYLRFKKPCDNRKYTWNLVKMQYYQAEQRKNVTDVYIKQRLNSQFKIPAKDISPELINLKRKTYELKKAIK